MKTICFISLALFAAPAVLAAPSFCPPTTCCSITDKAKQEAICYATNNPDVRPAISAASGVNDCALYDNVLHCNTIIVKDNNQPQNLYLHCSPSTYKWKLVPGTPVPHPHPGGGTKFPDTYQCSPT